MKPELQPDSLPHSQEEGYVSSTASVMIKAYTLSCLLLSLPLLWSVGDAWCHYTHFCVTSFGDGVAEFLMLATSE